MDRISTGNAGFDTVLAGGFPKGSLIVVAGAPGTGKTILTQQVCFANASSDHRALYYTTLSEPHTKMIRHLEPFGFFDEDGLGTRVDLVNLTGIYADDQDDAGGLKAAFAEIVRRCFTDLPSVVVVDSSKALREYDEPRFRQAIYELASAVAHSNAVMIFVGEYTPEEIAQSPEFAVADGIIELSNEDTGPINRRFMRVRKMRGTSYLDGRHSVCIDPAGFTIFPRLETTSVPAHGAGARRESIGVPVLDELMDGGPRIGDATLVLGPSGIGKTTLGLEFARSGLGDDETCLYVSFQEDASGLKYRAKSMGIDATGANGGLVVQHVPPVELDLDRLGVMLQDELTARPIKRVVIDSLAELAYAIRETERLPGFIFTMLGLISAAGASTLVTSETTLFGPTNEVANGLAVQFNNVISLRSVETDNDVARAMSVLNMRHSAFSAALIEYAITGAGIEPGERLQGVSGALGWSALQTSSL